MVLPGVGRDAAYVADRIATRSTGLGKAARRLPAAA
jgi:putative flavoprotein involved in K+ transport